MSKLYDKGTWSYSTARVLFDRVGFRGIGLKGWRPYRKYKYRVSTVSLPYDHSVFSDSAPQLFETMVFPGDDSFRDLYARRYATRAEAIAGHLNVVRLVRIGILPFRSEP